MTRSDDFRSDGDRMVVMIDVTNTLESDRITGIQRVTRELTAALAIQPSISLVLLRHCATCKTLRPIDDAERAALRQAPVAATRRVDRLPSPLDAIARSAVDSTLARRVVAAIRRRRSGQTPLNRTPLNQTPVNQTPADQRCAHRTLSDLAVPGSVFVDIEAAWWNPDDRQELLPALRSAGVHCALLAHDLLPLSNPEWFDENSRNTFGPWADAHLRSDAFVIANSRFTLGAVHARRDQLGLEPLCAEGVISFGAELPDDVAPAQVPGARSEHASLPNTAPYLLMVSTVEPRKNHDLALDLIAALDSRPDLRLVIVGKAGWKSAATIRRIKRAERNGGRVDWITSATDAELVNLYRGATLTVVPSFAEGFGLSVIESIAYGTPVLASTAAALREAGGDLVDYAAPNNLNEWIRSVERLTNPDGSRSPAADARAAALHSWNPPTWKDAADQFVSVVTTAHTREEK